MKRVLEVGVGGNTEYRFRARVPFHPNYEYYFCDKQPSYAWGVEIDYCDVEEYLPYPDGYFDEIYMSHVLEHLKDPEKAIREASRVLKKGGQLHIFVPSFLSKNAHADPDHKHFFTSLSIYNLLKKNGYTVLIPNGIIKKQLRFLIIPLMNMYDEIYLIGVKK